MSNEKKLDVAVTYPPTGDKLRDNNADRHELLGGLKTRVLIAFGLKEHDDEKIRKFVFFHDGAELTDLDKTLGQIAGDHDVLHLELAKERYFFFYTDKKIFSTAEAATGAQIKSMIKAVDPSFNTTDELILEGHGHEQDRVIGDSETVLLEVGEGHPAKHFFSKPPTNFGTP